MNLDQIRADLTHPRGATRAGMAAAVEQAEALAPEVIEIIDFACKGITLTPPQEDILFYGAHALAAARHTDLYDNLLALIENRPDEIESWFGDADFAAILIGTCPSDGELPYDLLENRNVGGSAKLDLFLLGARLVWEGRASRDAFVAFLDRFDREEMAPADDLAWHGWYTAVELLGLIEFEARGRAAWNAGRLPSERQVDRDEWVKALHLSARDPKSETGFALHGAAPIRDVFAALNWIRFRDPQQPDEDADPLDPAGDVCLGESELLWLEMFLVGELTPSAAMSLECLDGFLTALVAGPDAPPMEQWLPRVWGGDEAFELVPEYQVAAQEEYVRSALDRYRRTIKLRLEAGYPIQPAVDPDFPAEIIEDWAIGFADGMQMHATSWDAAARHSQAGPALGIILMLLPPEELAAPDGKIPLLANKERRQAIERLADIVRAIYAFWHDLPPLPLFEQRRGPKVGRNEPCPCGSGRKYKKCCGAVAPAR